MYAFIDRPQLTLLRRLLFQVHLWLGAIAGLYVLVVSITGAALVFRIDMQRAITPHLFHASEGTPADLATVLTSVQHAYPEYHVSGIDAPTTARPTVLAYVSRARELGTVLLDPVDAHVLGELPDRSFVRTLQDLHFDLLAGRTGRVVNGIGALCLLAMCATGLVIWWRGIASWTRGLTVDVRRGWKRITFDLHSAVGFWTAAVLAMWAVTGVNFAFGPQVRSIVNRLSPLTSVRTPSSNVAMREHRPPELRALLDDARRHMPGRFAARIVFPSSDASAVQVLFAKMSPTPLGPNALEPVFLDQYTGAVLQAPRTHPTAGDTIIAWMRPLHVGDFAGSIVKAGWFVLALSPTVLFVTGFVMWWNRVVIRTLGSAICRSAVPRLTGRAAARRRPRETPPAHSGGLPRLRRRAPETQDRSARRRSSGCSSASAPRSSPLPPPAGGGRVRLRSPPTSQSSQPSWKIASGSSWIFRGRSCEIPRFMSAGRRSSHAIR